MAVIGPGEPPNLKTHTGVFGSHYDSGRIVRILEPIPYFAQIAQAAIARFRPLEEQTGITFYHEVGYLVVSDQANYLRDMITSAARFYPQVEHIAAVDLPRRFPSFQFPAAVTALYQATEGGYLNPRQHIAAQNKALKMDGGMVIDQTVTGISGIGTAVQVKTSEGAYSAAKVVLASGAFANVGGIIPRPINFSVVPHTIVLGEISAVQLPSLAGMPSLSLRLGGDPLKYVYFMPPIQYPDGQFYVKIGHSIGELMPPDRNALISWFQGDGDQQRVDWLTETLRRLLPDVAFASFHSHPCVTTHSPTGKQYIDQFDDPRLYALLADHGLCGKSADELGYIAADFVMNGRFPSPYQAADYKLRYQSV